MIKGTMITIIILLALLFIGLRFMDYCFFKNNSSICKALSIADVVALLLVIFVTPFL